MLRGQRASPRGRIGHRAVAEDRNEHDIGAYDSVPTPVAPSRRGRAGLQREFPGNARI